jgi:hypothetical protein
MTTEVIRTVSMGLWLPIERSNFFEANDFDRALLKGYNGNDQQRTDPMHGMRMADFPSTAPRGRLVKRLQASVYYRLATVLPRFGYVYMFPQFRRPRKRHEDFLMAPHTAIITTAWLTEGSSQLPSRLEPVSSALRCLCLIANSDGYYIWIAFYRSLLTPAQSDGQPAMENDADENELRKQIRHALKEHVVDVFGGDYYSHKSGRANTGATLPENDTASLEDGLEDYRDKDLGILSFFQINLILEGMNNYNFDPRYFFDDGRTTPEDMRLIKEDYSLGNFIEPLTSITQLDPHLESALVQDVSRLIQDPESLNALDGLAIFGRIQDCCLTVQSKSDVLRQFLRQTSTEALNLMKWRLENCSQALVAIMISIAHLRHPLDQVEVPPAQFGTSGRQGKYYIPKKVNESQLHGYAILLAAKIPLLDDVWYYLDNALDGIRRQAIGEGKKEIAQALSGLENSWRALFRSISSGSAGLRHALEHAHMNAMLKETEDLRSEQETLSEITRIRERAGELSPTGSSTVSFISNVIALFAVAISFVFGLPSIVALVPQLGYLQQDGPVAIAGAALVAFTLGFFVFSILHRFLESIFESAYGQVRRKRLRSERYNYELDLKLSGRMDEDLASKFIDPSQQVAKAAALATSSGDRRAPRIDRGRNGPTRSSYRVNRVDEGEAVHKLYVDTFIYWPGRWTLWPVFTRRWLRVFFVYDILFHRPSDVNAYEMRGLHVVTSAKSRLQPEELLQLKKLTIEEFINPFLLKESYLDVSRDALISM